MLELRVCWPGRLRKVIVTGISATALVVASVVPLKSMTDTRATDGPFAMLAGITSVTNVTALACYGTCPGGGSHAYTNPNPIDMGAGTTTPAVYVQNDYLPDDISGGYLTALRIMTGCGAYESPNYNGRRVKVSIYYYDTSSNYVNWNHESYLHIDPDYDVVDTSSESLYWFHWNNTYATTQLWPYWLEEFEMNNLTSGGIGIGQVTNVASPVTGCTDGNHLHQESDADGEYAPNLDVGDATTARYTDAHYVTLTGIAGEAP